MDTTDGNEMAPGEVHGLIVDRMEDVTAEALLNSLPEFYIGLFRYKIKLAPVVSFGAEDQLMAYADFADQSITLLSRLRGQALFNALLTAAAEVFDWHFSTPTNADERHKLMASFAMNFWFAIEPEVTLRFWKPADKKSGSPHKPATVPPESKDSSEARDVAAA